MDMGSQTIGQELPQSTECGQVPALPSVCSLCRRIVSTDTEVNNDLETIRMCGDCKFLFLEDVISPQDSHQRRIPRGRRTRYSSSESMTNLFSQQFLHMINLVRQNQSTFYGHEGPTTDGDSAARSLQSSSSSRATPGGSRGWRRVFSDTESDGFDNVDSLYGDSESNVSFGRYRIFYNEIDAISFSAYGGDSDASVDGWSSLDTEMFTQPDLGSEFESNTDIDPMHAGLDQWNSDELEEEEEGEEDVYEWEEADDEEDTIRSTEATTMLPHSLILGATERSGPGNWRQQFHSPEIESAIHQRNMEGRHTYTSNIFANLEDSDLQHYNRTSRNYLDARGLDELLEHLAEGDNLRRGAPPAALSSVNNLPRVVINEEHLKHDDLACAICKEVLPAGTEVIKLPCFHLYHGSCILPWLSARNSCPLCRYELPTDDKDYEDTKWNIRDRMEIQELQQQDVGDNDGVEADEEHEFNQGRTEQRRLLDVDPSSNSSGRRSGRGRWLFLAAAPLVSLVGIVLGLWLGNPPSERREPASHCNVPRQGQHQICVSSSSLPNHRENRSRRWSFF